MASGSVFDRVTQAPEDAILGVTVAYNKDTSPNKLNLGVGAYRTEEGKPLVLSVVKRAESILVNDASRVKEYLPIVGLADFNKLSAQLIFGINSPAIQENRVTTVQCLSGTGSLRVGAEFLARHHHQLTIYIPNPTWGNHTKIFTIAGLSVKTYRYYDPATRGLDFQGLVEDLGAAPAGAIVLLHACAHNPTGVDPTPEQWEQIRQLIRSKELLPFFDSAYQGFASGSLDADAHSVRTFVADGGECLVAQSYAKNMGLYGERVCKASDVAGRVESQLKLVIRPMYSNPPIHGASIVATLKAMADRIISMRQELFDALSAKGGLAWQVTAAYNKDTSPDKLNLGIGAYRTEEGKPLVLNVVKRAENILVSDPSRNKEYLPVVGLAEFNKLSAQLVFGANSSAIQENRVATAQCLSGTGSLRVGAEFLARNYHQHTIYIPNPTWKNHPSIFANGGLSVKTYRYYNAATHGLDFQGLLEDLGAAPAGAIVLLHACAHNPTGVDPTSEQWEQIRQLIRSKELLPFFDIAYQGFASGSLDADAQSVRMFVADGGECLVAQSYSKNMGLYGERVCETSDVASRVESRLELVIRPMYSNPPIHGASILKAMADRIISMRQQLFDALSTRGTPGDWSHIIKQIGMFTFTGLNSEQED
ncbi:hypothetical protein Tsubulata_031800 [Turnera subulata]|uniref:Aminotransferase class I/classII large domain-containing protein n=1 Tax=Turnera subulata TaxID=218843 RepID=A0A9Q0JQJ5_9ROSI|nr:hypothetical protein Tsubulata_031800 [Turnera subulata]